MEILYVEHRIILACTAPFQMQLSTRENGKCLTSVYPRKGSNSAANFEMKRRQLLDPQLLMLVVLVQSKK